MDPTWEKDQYDLRAAGFSEEEINEERVGRRTQLIEAGFSDKDADDYFGKKELDTTQLKQTFTNNLQKAAETKAPTDPNKPQPKVAESFWDVLEAGWDMSVAGLGIQQKMPDVVLPENAPMYARIASQVATVAGDLPAMIGGMVLGGGAGTAVAGPVGSVVGSGAGGFALPTAIRETMMQAYEKGEVQDFKDFWERASAVFIETTKSAVIGAATGGVGGIVNKVAAPLVRPMVQTTAKVASEVATMTTVGAALEGHAPNPQDFIDAAILVGGMHGAGVAASKLRQTYAKTGAKPHEVATEALQDPVTRQELLIEGEQVPTSFKSQIDPKIEAQRVQAKNEHLAKLDETIAQKKALEAEPPTPDSAAKLAELDMRLDKLMDEGMQKYGPTPVSEVPGSIFKRDSNFEKIREKIGEKKDAPKEKYKFDDFYRDFVDKLDPISKAVKQLGENPNALETIENPYRLARMVNDHKAKVRYMVERGTIDYKTLEKNGKSLKEILDPIKDDMVSLEDYMVSKRAVELEARGIKSGFDTASAKNVVAKGKGKFEKVAQEVTEFQNNVLGYLRDSGMVSKEAYAKMVEANKSYVSFKRISEEGQVKAGKSKGSPVKAIKGSDKSIQSPITSILENTEFYMKLAEQNRAVESFVKLAEKTEGQTLIEKVKTPKREIEVKSDEIARALEAQGVIVTKESVARDLKARGFKFTPEQLEKAFEKEQLTNRDAIEAFSIFRGQSKDLAPNEFEVFRNGKREVYKTEPALAEAFKTLDGNTTAQHAVLKIAQNIARKVTTVKKIAISMTPEFIMRNIFRDQLTAGTFSKKGYIPFLDILPAMKDIVAKNDHYYNWLKSGGANGAFFEINQRYLETNVFKLNKEMGPVAKAWNVIDTAVGYAKLGAELAEQGTRLAEFKRMTGGNTSAKSLMDAGFAAREITIDFQRIGARTAAFNSITAFQNVAIQGLDRTVRAVKDDPVGVTTKAAAAITVPSVLLWWANKDDERYKAIPRWQKDLFWIVPTDNWVRTEDPREAEGLPPYLLRQSADGRIEINKGTIYRIPKPQELGIIFGSLPERALEAFFQDNPRAMQDFEETISELLTPALSPDIATPAIEQYFNKNMFTGNNIVPHHLEGILPEYQYSHYTSETGKVLGKFVQAVPFVKDWGPDEAPLASPMVIDNYVRSWGGTIGQYAVQVADQMLIKSGAVEDPVKPEASLADLPVIKAFVVRYPSMSAQHIQDFYDIHEKNTKFIKTLQWAAKNGDYEAVEKMTYANSNEEMMFKLDGIKTAISNQNSFIRMIYNNKDMSPADKRQAIDGVYYQMIEAAKTGVMLADEFKKIVNKERKQ